MEVSWLLPGQIIDVSEGKQINEENQLLVTVEPVRFEKEPVAGQDVREITKLLRGILYGICLRIIKKIQKITTCNWVDLSTLGF